MSTPDRVIRYRRRYGWAISGCCATPEPDALLCLSDHLGAPRQIAALNSKIVWSWDHDPFGNGAPVSTLTYNLRFPGQYFDSETGLHYNMARDYVAGLGRYAQSDPIGLLGGINTFGYVGGNPISATDPTGEFSTYLQER